MSRAAALTSPVRLGHLAGDGIGPDVTAAAVAVADAACDAAGAARPEWIPLPVGWEAIEKGLSPLPAETVAALEECDGWLLGPVDFVSYPGEARRGRNPSGELRHRFDLYANIRPARTFSGVPSTVDSADLVIVRENTEGFYADRNMLVGAGDLLLTKDVALAIGVFTRSASARVAHAACRLALTRRKHVTIGHKANVLANSMGLFLETAKEVAAQYDVECDDYHVDALAAQFVRRCSDFDVVLCENFIGDVFSDLTGELTGSLGLAPSINASDERAMAQAAHGSAPDISGLGIANPVGEILSVKLLLDWLSARRGDARLNTAARTIEEATAETFSDGIGTADVGGTASTAEFSAELIQRIRGRKLELAGAGAGMEG